MAVLTVDDAPSTRFAEKLAWLRKEKIPAVFFVWGELAAGAEDLLVEALDAGYPLGNHSWTHPRFSDLDEAGARYEIERTDRLLASLYERAGVRWERKYFRFPYFDRGDANGGGAAFQRLLAEWGYEALDSARQDAARQDAARQDAERRDSLCDFDQMEYWLGKAEAPDGLDRPETILSRIGGGHPADDDVILIHDHQYSHDLFFRCLARYREAGIAFSLP